MAKDEVSCLSENCATSELIERLGGKNVPPHGPALPGEIGLCVPCVRRINSDKAITSTAPYVNLFGEYPVEMYLKHEPNSSPNVYENGQCGPLIRWDPEDYELNDEHPVSRLRHKSPAWVEVPDSLKQYDQTWLKTLFNFDPTPHWPDSACVEFSLMVCDNSKCRYHVLSHVDQCSARGGKLAAYNLKTGQVVCTHCEQPVIQVKFYDPSDPAHLIKVKNTIYTACSICATPIEFNNRFAVQMCTVCNTKLVKKAKINENVCFCCRRPANGPARQGSATYIVDGKKSVLCRVHRLRGVDSRREVFTSKDFMAALRRM